MSPNLTTDQPTTSELDKYQGCFYEDGPEACEKEIHVSTSFDCQLLIVCISSNELHLNVPR